MSLSFEQKNAERKLKARAKQLTRDFSSITKQSRNREKVWRVWG
jgi:hypothetical protein